MNAVVGVAFRKAMAGGLFDKIVGLRAGLPGMIYSHCEFCWPGKSFIVSASFIGWKRQEYSPSEWDILPLPVDEEESQTLAHLCETLLQSKPRYDWPGLVHIGALHLAGRELPKWWFCSEQVAWALRKLGYVDLFCLDKDAYTPSLVAYTITQWRNLPQPVADALASMARARRGRK